MALNFDVVHVLNEVSAFGTHFAQGHAPEILGAAVPLFVGVKVSDYRRRWREERVWTGAEGAVTKVPHLSLQRGRRAHELNPALPAVTVLRIPKPYLSISSTRTLWWTPCGEYDEPHMVAIAMTRAGKNQTLLDPTVWNVLRYRLESAVVMDAKGDMVARFASRIGRGQWVFTFLEEHPSSCAINLIETPRMAASTAAALYSVEHTKVPAFGMGARDIFEALAEALGYSESDIVELFQCLKNPERLRALAETNERLRVALTGENRKFIADVITSARLPLAALGRPEVARVFAPEPGAPQPHFEKKEIVWVCIPQDAKDVALLAGAIVHNLYNRATKSRRGTYFLVDEAGSIMTIENLDHYLQVGRGLGAYFFLILQDVSQLQDKLGVAKTRSVLGNAGVQFWGKSNDTETARYASDLSGQVRVQYRNYEHHGAERAWKQFWEAKGAPFKLEDRNRAGLMTEHIHGLPRGWWYVYSGEPTAISLRLPAPMYEWEDQVLPPPTSAAHLLLALEEPSGDEPDGAAVDTEPAPEWVAPTDSSPPDKEPPQPRPEEISEVQRAEAGNTRPCPGCESPVSDAARFCENCGGRL